MLASDAAARGLDFPALDWILQYDPPQRIEEYLHRVGRTARIGRKGNSLLFLQPSELGFLDVLRAKGVTSLRKLNEQQLVGSLLDHGAPRELALARDLSTLMLASLKRHVEEHSALLRLARGAFLASLRSYRAFPRELRQAFDSQSLHLGHFAGSFALRETPAEISRKGWHDSNVANDDGRRGRGRAQDHRGRGGGRGGASEGVVKVSDKTRARPGTRVSGGRRQVNTARAATDEFAC